MSDTLAEGLNSRHLKTGDPCPPLKGKLRVYNFKYCTKAERVLLAIEQKGIPYEVVNINPNEQPEWYRKEKNPLGCFPTCETGDGKQIVFDSLICVEWLDNIYPQAPQMLATDPYRRAKGRMIFEQLNEITPVLFAALSDQQNDEKINTLNNALKKAENLLNEQYFEGSKPGYADYMYWSWFERLDGAEAMEGGKIILDGAKFPKIKAYVERMKTDPVVLKVMRPASEWAQFFKTYSSGTPDYDITTE